MACNQVKIIKADTADRVEEKTNVWLRQSLKTIISISISECEASYTVLIVYETK